LFNRCVCAIVGFSVEVNVANILHVKAHTLNPPL